MKILDWNTKEVRFGKKLVEMMHMDVSQFSIIWIQYTP